MSWSENNYQKSVYLLLLFFFFLTVREREGEEKIEIFKSKSFYPEKSIKSFFFFSVQSHIPTYKARTTD